MVIDDIDRLTFEEIRLLFRLVKANADFPRFIYLLLFQKNNAIKALDPVCDNQGAEYLEKIVQVGYDVPEIKRHALHKILGLGVDEVMSRLKVEKKFDPERWVKSVHPRIAALFCHASGRLPLFERIFIPQFPASAVVSFSRSTSVDLIATEVFRVFEHRCFAVWLRRKNS